MHTTLISTAELAGAPRRSRARHRRRPPRPRAARRAGASRSTARAHMPGALFLRTRPRPLRAEDRRQRPPSAAVARGVRRRASAALGIGARHAGRRLRPAAAARTRARLWWMLRWLGHDAVGGARRRLREVGARRPAGHHRGAARRTRRVRRSAAVAATVDAARCARASRERRCSWSTRGRPSAFAARRADRSGGRPHPGRASTGRSRRTSAPTARSSPPSVLRAEFARLLGGAPADAIVHSVRLRRDGLPQPARDGSRRPARHAAVSRIVERVVRRSVASGRAAAATRSSRG